MFPTARRFARVILYCATFLGVGTTAGADPFLSVQVLGGPTSGVATSSSLPSMFRPWGGGPVGDGAASNNYLQGLPYQPADRASATSISKTFGTGAVYYSDATTLNGLRDEVLPKEATPCGQLTAKLTSVDLDFDDNHIGSYINDDPYIDSQNSRSTEQGNQITYAGIYARCIIARTGRTQNHNGQSVAPIRSDGTTHRLLIEFSGLKPNSQFAFRFYAYDDNVRQGVYVFTDVTADPFQYLGPATAGEIKTRNRGVFIPGPAGRQDFTQYAPDGQYIWTNGKPPASNSQYSATLIATADPTGKVVFAETTVVGLYGAYQAMPVLNGFEIESLSAGAVPTVVPDK